MISNITKLFRQEVKFIAGASKITQMPKLFLPEIAFVGKSNVGKSSLINALCNHHNLARVSHTPGRTQQINFFDLGKKLTLVDLPGYGFAKVPIHTKQQWEILISYYLQYSENLKLVNLLIDARRGIKEHDARAAELLLSYHRNFQIIFTKSDKATDKENLMQEVENFLATLNYSCNVIYTSSRQGYGIKELQFSISQMV